VEYRLMPPGFKKIELEERQKWEMGKKNKERKIT
jgi:hypothetical protein